MPSERARGENAGQRVSCSRDSAWNHRPSTVASMQGPSPVAYWLASMSEIVSSLAATVASCPRRRRVTLAPSAPPTVARASATTRPSAPFTTSSVTDGPVTARRLGTGSLAATAANSLVVCSRARWPPDAPRSALLISSAIHPMSKIRATPVDEKRIVSWPPWATRRLAAPAVTASPTASIESASGRSMRTDGYPLAMTASKRAPSTGALAVSTSPRMPSTARSPAKLAEIPKSASGTLPRAIFRSGKAGAGEPLGDHGPANRRPRACPAGEYGDN